MRVATIHLEIDEEQRRSIDLYMEEYGVPTKTQVLDEALGEFFAKRRMPYQRRYGKTTGPTFTGDYNRRSTDRETA